MIFFIIHCPVGHWVILGCISVRLWQHNRSRMRHWNPSNITQGVRPLCQCCSGIDTLLTFSRIDSYIHTESWGKQSCSARLYTFLYTIHVHTRANNICIFMWCFYDKNYDFDKQSFLRLNEKSVLLKQSIWQCSVLKILCANISISMRSLKTSSKDEKRLKEVE